MRDIFSEQEGMKVRGCASTLAGSRNMADTISDLKAQVAANNKGVELLREFIRECGQREVLRYMGFVQDNASRAVQEMLKDFIKRERGNDVDSADSIRGKKHEFFAEDSMDDGTRIKLRVEVDLEGEEGEKKSDGPIPTNNDYSEGSIV